MIPPDPAVLGAAWELRDIIEIVVLAVIYFVFPLINEYLKKRRGTEEPAAPVPVFEPPAAPMPEAPRLEVPAGQSTQDVLQAALRAWRREAGPILGRRTAARLGSVAEAQVAEAAADELADVDEETLTLAAAVTALTRAAERASAPSSRLLHEGARALLGGVLAAHELEAWDAPPALLPLGLAVPEEADALAHAAGYVPVRVAPGLSPIRRLALLEETARSALLQVTSDTERVLARAFQDLVALPEATPELAPAVQAVAGHPSAGSFLLDGLTAALVARHTGPLGWLLLDADRAPRAFGDHRLREILYARAAARSPLVAAAVPPAEGYDLLWHRVADLLDRAMEVVGFGGPTRPPLAARVPVWGPSEDAETGAVAAWHAAGARGPVPERPLPPAVALVAWRLAERGAGLTREQLDLLLDGVIGAAPAAAGPAEVRGVTEVATGTDAYKRRFANAYAGAAEAGTAAAAYSGAAVAETSAAAYLAAAPAAAAAVAAAPRPSQAARRAASREQSSRGAAAAREAFLLQVLLGPPHARRHPALAGGPRRIVQPWSRVRAAPGLTPRS